jgi:hypothetical protein
MAEQQAVQYMCSTAGTFRGACKDSSRWRSMCEDVRKHPASLNGMPTRLFVMCRMSAAQTTATKTTYNVSSSAAFHTVTCTIVVHLADIEVIRIKQYLLRFLKQIQEFGTHVISLRTQ